jgi:hypothetical protein
MYGYSPFVETIEILAEGLGGQFAEVAVLANQAVARRCAERGLPGAELSHPGGTEDLLRLTSWQPGPAGAPPRPQNPRWNPPRSGQLSVSEASLPPSRA